MTTQSVTSDSDCGYLCGKVSDRERYRQIPTSKHTRAMEYRARKVKLDLKYYRLKPPVSTRVPWDNQQSYETADRHTRALKFSYA